MLHLTKNKQSALVLAAMMVALSCSVVFMADHSDADSAQGDFDLYVFNGSNWTDIYGATGYSAMSALIGSDDVTDYEIDTAFVVTKVNDWGPYDTINSNYGKVTSINNVSENSDNVWNIYYLDAQNVWKSGVDATGFIIHYDDAAVASATVVFYYGAPSDVVPSEVSSHVTGAHAIATCTDVYTFSVRDSTGSNSVAAAGLVFTSTGSNAYAAFMKYMVNVPDANVQSDSSYGENYGTIYGMFGLSTAYVGGNYHYWNLYDNNGYWTSFYLGHYSIADGAPSSDSGSFGDYMFDLDTFRFVYA